MPNQLGNRVAWLLVGALSGAGVYATLNHDMHRESVARPRTARASLDASAATFALTPAEGAQSTEPVLEDFFRALAHVESSNNPNPPPGDNGKSHGPYQIQFAYWRDAWGLDREPVTEAMRARYRWEVADPATARRTMLGYFRRYCPEALESRDWMTLAATHNGGPTVPRLLREGAETAEEAKRLRNATTHAHKVLAAMEDGR